MTNFYNKLYSNSWYGYNTNFYGMLENYNKPYNKRELFKLLKEQKLFNKFCLALANITQGKYKISVDENNEIETYIFQYPKTQLNSFIETVLQHTKYDNLSYIKQIINPPYDLKMKIT